MLDDLNYFPAPRHLSRFKRALSFYAAFGEMNIIRLDLRRLRRF